MKRSLKFGSTILHYSQRLFACCLIGGSIVANAQQAGANAIFEARTGGPGVPGERHGGLVINGSDIGTILFKACDINADGAVTAAELKEVASASFKIWDTNADSNVSQLEFSTAMKELFPAPPEGARLHAVRVINGVAVEVAPGDLPTPDAQVTKRTFAGADANQDGLISTQELNDFLDKGFSRWDRDGSASLSADELSVAFFELSCPDAP